MSATPVFYFDLGSPYAYLAAERIGRLIPTARWQPILLGGLFKLTGRSSWGTGPGRADGMVEVERRAEAYGLPPVRWPHPWPGDMLTVMRAATFAARQGREVAFALAAFRRAFAAGEDLGRPEPILEAAAQTDLDPARVRAAAADPAVKDALRQATEDAHARGVTGVPTLRAGNRLYWGDDRLDAAARSLAGPAAGAGYS